METVPQRITRFDAFKARRTYRKQREKGVWLYVSAVELEQMGIDPAAETPTFKAWVKSKHSLQLRFYTVPLDEPTEPVLG